MIQSTFIVVIVSIFSYFVCEIAYAENMNEVDSRQMNSALRSEIDIDAKDSNGQTLLMRMALAKDLVSVRRLVDHGARIELKDRHGFTAIDILKSHIRRAGSNRELTITALRQQGLSEDSISNLIGDSRKSVYAFSEDDRIAWQEILEFLQGRQRTRIEPK